MGADGAAALGNVGPCRPFQFAIVDTASLTGIRSVPWAPKVPGRRYVATNCWIYAVEVGAAPGKQIPILAAEFQADQHGNLGFVPGAKRRTVEAKEKGAPIPVSIPTAAAVLPLVRQGKQLR